jgi:membrane protein DedA with SNARE-associated domain
MLLFSVLAAVLGGLIQGGRQQQTFVVIGVAAPMGVMILMSIVYQIGRLMKKRRKP